MSGNFLPDLFALIQSLGFQTQALTERQLQEKGASPLSTFALQRYALVPALVWSFFFVRPADISYVLHTPLLFFYIVAVAVLWNVQGFLWSYLQNTTSSMSSISTLNYLLYLPLLLVVGTFFNHDVPNLWILCAIILLVLAFAMQPAQHEHNIRARFSLPLAVLVTLSLVRLSVDAINNGLTRAALEMLGTPAYLGMFSVLATGLCLMWTLLIHKPVKDAAVLRRNGWMAVGIPLIWFAASIPEAYSYASLPIYTVVSVGIATFLLVAASDLYHKRIRFNVRTAGFIVLVLAGTALAAYSA